MVNMKFSAVSTVVFAATAVHDASARKPHTTELCPPIDVMLLQDTTLTMYFPLRGTLAGLESLMQRVLSRNGRMAVAEFKDKPVEPYGYSGFDICYRRSHEFTTDTLEILTSFCNLYASGGYDAQEGMLEGLLATQIDPEMGWGQDHLRITIMSTDATPHLSGDIALPEHPMTLEAIQRCDQFDYPSLKKVFEVLEQNQEVLIIVTTDTESGASARAWYEEELKFTTPGFVRVLTMKEDGSDFNDLVFEVIQEFAGSEENCVTTTEAPTTEEKTTTPEETTTPTTTSTPEETTTPTTTSTPEETTTPTTTSTSEETTTPTTTSTPEETTTTTPEETTTTTTPTTITTTTIAKTTTSSSRTTTSRTIPELPEESTVEPATSEEVTTTTTSPTTTTTSSSRTTTSRTIPELPEESTVEPATSEEVSANESTTTTKPKRTTTTRTTPQATTKSSEVSESGAFSSDEISCSESPSCPIETTEPECVQCCEGPESGPKLNENEVEISIIVKHEAKEEALDLLMSLLKKDKNHIFLGIRESERSISAHSAE